MAVNGSIDSGGYQGRVLRFEWSTVSTNAETNVRVIHYKITAIGGSSSIYYHHNDYVNINGVRVYTGSDSHGVKTGTVLAEDDFSINQNNTIQLIVNMHGGIYYRTDNINTDKTWTLDEIPRYSDITSLSIKSRTINSITISYVVSRSASIYCSIDGGTTWLNNGNPFKTNTTNGEITIYYKDKASTSRLEPNTSYTITILSRATVSGLDRTSSVSTTTYDIAKLVSVPNINIGDSQNLTWTNPSGATTSLKLCKTDNSTIIDYGTVTGTSKTVTPTANTIYALTPNSNTYTARYIITTTANSTNYTNYKDFTFTVTNSNPIFSNFNYADINEETLALTGNSQILIKGYSTNKIMIEEEDRAVAKNSATMKSYKVVQGSKSATVEYSGSSSVSMSISNIDNATMTVYATDSRGNSSSIFKTALYKEYAPIIIKSVLATRSNNGVGQKVTLSYEGTFWNENFGSIDNSIIQLSYNYKETSASSYDETKEIGLTPTIENEKYSGSISIQGDLGANGFSVEKSFNIRLTAKDKLTTKTYEYTLSSGTPGIAIYKNNVAIGQKYDTSVGGSLQIKDSLVIGGIKVLWVE